MKKYIEIFLLLILMIGIVIGISHTKKEEKPKEKEEESVVLETYIDELAIPLIELDSMNPLKTKNYQINQALNLIYEPLFEYDSDESFRCVLAEDYSKIDAKTWLITLKKDVLWHDEEFFNSYDVIFTINALKERALIYSPNVENIENVERLDGSSFKIYLNEEDDFFIHKLTFPILPEHYYSGSGFDDENKEKRPIGTGPYKYQETTENGDIVLAFYENWWKQKDAKLKKIILRNYATYGEAIKGFKSAKVDLIVTNMAEWEGKFGTIGSNHYSFENSQWEVLIPNCQSLFLQDMTVRRAVLEAINRESIINRIYQDNAVISDLGVHTNSKNSVSNYEYDIEQAKQLLLNADWFQDEKGWYHEIEGKKQYLSLTLLVNRDDQEKMQVAEWIQDDLKELGIILTIQKVSLNEIKERIQNGQFELALVTLDMKGETDLIQSVSENSKRNYANFHSNQMQEVIEKIKVSGIQSSGIMDEFINRYKSEVPYMGLYYKTSTLLTNKSVKGNFNPSWSKAYRNIESFCK